MINKKKSINTEEPDLQDFFLAMRERDPIFLQAIAMTTKHDAIRLRINAELHRKKTNCKAEIIRIAY